MKRRHSATSAHCYLSLTSSRFLSSLLPVLCAQTASTTETMLPRRFRTRVLFAVILIGVCLLISAYYAPDSHLMIKVREPARFWTLLWSATENCPVHSPEPAAERWNTAELYPKLDFRVPDNGGMGFWNDALEKRYREIRENWKDLPLKVIIVPHSHVDPGWLRTFDDYHISLVSDILDNMVKFLNKTEDFKFIWSEISYFAKWWEKQNEVTRSVVKKILQRQQLEFVTGGWVMPDEAVTSYFATIDQLIEGHQWLQHSLGTLPKRGWSVDVFGHSGSYPYILSSAGISEIVIMRTHYAWKKFFAESQAFDFYWEQPFHSPRVLCHMAPSDLYSFKYACGPDPVICLKFDFRQIDREYSESTADKITDQNVENKAGYLLSQYGRFASLLPHNVLLVPLGDDFRYNVEIEWVQQLENYKKLFNFINNKKDWNVHIQFGTVSDYFNEVNSRMYNNLSKPLKSVEGDFLPYADIYANFRPSYWTGFYTTRPFYKKLSQELEYWLRTSEILYSLAKTLVSKSFQKILSDDYAFLTSARQKLALFQHHDAITGTSKEMVMRDYGKKLHTGIIDAMSVVSHATQLLMMEHLLNSQHWTSQIYPDVYRSAFDQPTKKLSIAVPDNGRKIILFNSLTVERTEMVRIRVKTPLLKVIDSNLQDVPFQINPVFKDQLTISSTVFELLFVAFLKPLSYTVYTIVGIQDSDREKLPKTVILLSFNNDAEEPPMHSAFTFEKKNDEPIKLDSQKISATFSHYGHLKSIYLKESGLFTSLDIDFLTYHSWMYRSGAYLFNPDTAAVPVRNQTDHFPLLSVIRGPLMSELKITHHNILMFSIRIFNYENASTALQLEVTSDVSKMAEDVELIMRIKSDVKNEGIFYTDSNGFQMLKRTFVSRLPVQGNYYPATSAVFIEDENMRMNVLLPHSHGVTCTNGQIEVMLDRKIHNDDGRGVGEGVEDSRVSSAVFWLLPESQFSKQSNIQLSTDAFWLSLFLLHPPTILVPEHSKMDFIKSHLSFLEGSWPYDVHLINLRTLPQEDYNLPSNDSLMIIYQKHLTCPSKAFTDLMINEIDHHSPFSIVKVKSIVKTSLTGTSVISHDVNSLTPQLLQSCKITFQK